MFWSKTTKSKGDKFTVTEKMENTNKVSIKSNDESRWPESIEFKMSDECTVTVFSLCSCSTMNIDRESAIAAARAILKHFNATLESDK